MRKEEKGKVMVEMKEEDIQEYNRLFSEIRMLLESDYSLEEIINFLDKMKK